MEIVNRNNQKLSVTTELQPLFDAMKEEKMIHSVTFKIGSTDENITLTSFTAQMYEVAINEQLNSSWCHDLVTIYVNNPINGRKIISFYMNWIISFEL